MSSSSLAARCSSLLITGGAGFIGSCLVRQLVAREEVRVINFDKLTYAGNIESLASVIDSPLHTFVQGDIADRAAVREVMEAYQPQAVINLAAESHVDRSIDGPAEFIRTNIIGTFELLEAARAFWNNLPSEERTHFRFLHVSTDEVYGSLGPSGKFVESSPYDPSSPYSASKASSDHLVRAYYRTYGLPTLITNCSNNYGPYQFPEKLIPVVILKCLRGEPIPVYGRGENIRDWLYVEDHCSALCCVVERGTPGETYNIGGNNELRNIDLVTLLCDILDELRPRADGRCHREQITFVTDRPGHDLRYAIDASKIASELGWHPQHDRASGFRRTVEWYLVNTAWWQRLVSGEYSLERHGLPASSFLELPS